MQAASAGVGHVRGDLGELEALHKGLGRRATTVKAKAHNAAGTVGHVLLSQVIVLVALQARIAHEAHLGMTLQELGNGQAVLAMTRHAHMQALERAVQEERRLRVLHGAKIAHELRGGLGDEGALATELLGIRHAVVALVGRGETRELVRMGHPVKLAVVDNHATQVGCMAIHVLGGGVRNDVCAPLKGTAHHGRREGIVDHQRHAVVMCGLGKALNIEHGKGGVGDRLAKDELGIGLKGCLELLVGAVGGNERTGQTHALHGMCEQVVGTAVDGRARDHVIASAGHVKDREEVRSHTRAREHRSGAALHLANLGGNQVARGVLQTAIEVARLLQVEQLAHVLGRVVLPRGGLVDGHLARLRVARAIAALNTCSTDSLLAHI